MEQKRNVGNAENEQDTLKKKKPAKRALARDLGCLKDNYKCVMRQ